MASNNYAEVITDTIKGGEVLATFEGLAAVGRAFKALEFNPDTDRFAISCGRESTFPPYPDVEHRGVTLASENARALWKAGDAVEAVSFGNGQVGLLCGSDDGRYRMVIPADSAIMHATGKQRTRDHMSHTRKLLRWADALTDTQKYNVSMREYWQAGYRLGKNEKEMLSDLRRKLKSLSKLLTQDTGTTSKR